MAAEKVRLRWVAGLLAFHGSVGLSYGQFWDYQHVDVEGHFIAKASVTALAAGIDEYDEDRHDFAQRIVLADPSVLDARGSGDVRAEVAASFIDDCRTEASAAVKGTVAFDLDGDASVMTAVIESRRSHSNVVRRGLSAGGGSFVGTSSEFDVPQANALTAVFPVRVAGHPLGGLVTIDSFTASHNESGGAGDGITVCSWEWFHDRNSNGQIDPTEISLGAQVLEVFANQSASAPSVSFQAARGYHLLRITYFTNSTVSESGNSYNCSFPVDENNDVDDMARLELSLW